MAEANVKPPPPKTQENPAIPLSSFLYKAVFVFVLLALLPLFSSSQSTELPNKTILTRSWELLQLLLVGIVISYGLFSRRNSDPDLEKEIQLKPDTPQSYVSQILEVSSVFDEEVDSPNGLNLLDETKNQTWNYSQYYREKPVVMVAEESAGGDDSSVKPLLLPVRSLKDSTYENGKEETGDKDGNVLPSPIPWRSRSGRMEVNSVPSSVFDTELGPPKVPSSRYSTPISTSGSPSPKRLSPSSSLSPEIRGKMNEDVGRKKSFSKSSPPPAPPPPPLPLKHAIFSNERRDTMRSFKDELVEDLSKRGKEFAFKADLSSASSFIPDKSPYIGKSVRTIGTRETQSLPTLLRNQTEMKNGFVGKKMIVSDSESDDDSDSESADIEEGSNQEAPPEENEVDKKADEFIAKFREQIRLQRIESIKKSSGQRTKRNCSF